MSAIRLELSTETRVVRLGDPIDLFARLGGVSPRYSRFNRSADEQTEHLVFEDLGIEMMFAPPLRGLRALWLHIRQEDATAASRPFAGAVSRLDADFWRAPTPDLFRSRLAAQGFEYVPHQSRFATDMLSDELRYRYTEAPHAENVVIDDGQMIRKGQL